MPRAPTSPAAPILPAAIRAALLTRPILRDLPDADTTFLLNNAWYAHIKEGVRFIVEDTAAEAVFFVLNGEVAIENGDRTLALQRAPRTIGLLSVIDGLDRSASVRAFSNVDVVMVPRDAFDALMARSPTFATRLVAQLTDQIRGAHRHDASVRKNFDDHFHTPNARLVQGPYAMGSFPMYALVVQTDISRIRACLPPGLTVIPGLGGRYLLTFNFFPNVYSQHSSAEGRGFAYNETTAFLPVIGPGARPAVYSPELYLDSYMPIVLGRELYGFPKRFGSARLGERHIDLTIGREMALRLQWESRRSVDAGELLALLQGWLIGRQAGLPSAVHPMLRAVFEAMDTPSARRFWPAMPVYVHSQVPSAMEDAEDGMRIDELVEIPFNVHEVGDFEVLDDATLRTFSDWILAGDAIGGVCLQMSASFGRSRRVQDYLRTEPESALQRHARPWRESARDLVTRVVSGGFSSNDSQP